MKIAVFGSGGVGGYFGGRLAQAGEQVVFIARGEHLDALRKQGLKVDSPKGDFHLKEVRATDQPAEAGVMDVILLGVKAWQVAEAARAMQPMVGPETFVVPLQNGVDAPDQLAEALGKEHVLGGLCHISSHIAAPGYIRHVGIEPDIAFGELDNHPSQRCQVLKEAFERAGVKVMIPVDIHVAMWEKFLFIAAISSVGAVTRAPVGILRKLPETRALLEGAMREIMTVAQASRIDLNEGHISRTFVFIDNLPEGTRASMQRDILEGRPSELAWQNGAVVRRGRERGVPTPINEMIYAALLPQEMRARGEVSF